MKKIIYSNGNIRIVLWNLFFYPLKFVFVKQKMYICITENLMSNQKKLQKWK